MREVGAGSGLPEMRAAESNRIYSTVIPIQSYHTVMTKRLAEAAFDIMSQDRTKGAKRAKTHGMLDTKVFQQILSVFRIASTM